MIVTLLVKGPVLAVMVTAVVAGIDAAGWIVKVAVVLFAATVTVAGTESREGSDEVRLTVFPPVAEVAEGVTPSVFTSRQNLLGMETREAAARRGSTIRRVTEARQKREGVIRI